MIKYVLINHVAKTETIFDDEDDADKAAWKLCLDDDDSYCETWAGVTTCKNSYRAHWTIEERDSGRQMPDHFDEDR